MNKKKDQGKEMYEKGLYDEAIKLYKQAADLAEMQLSKFDVLKVDAQKILAAVYNNVGLCYKQQRHHNEEVVYATKVIELAKSCDDKNLLTKALLRRGMAYEQNEKYRQAKEDFVHIKTHDPYNRQASEGMTRV